MGKRLIVGLIKGLLVGAAVGAGVQAGLGWTTPGLLGYLLAAATGASAGLVCGKAPWRQSAWLEGVLKAIAGVLFGAGAFWGLGHLSGSLGFELFGAGADVPWNEQPLLLSPLIAGVFGALIELDNTGDDTDGTAAKKSKRPPRARAGGADAEAVAVGADSAETKVKNRRRQWPR